MSRHTINRPYDFPVCDSLNAHAHAQSLIGDADMRFLSEAFPKSPTTKALARLR